MFEPATFEERLLDALMVEAAHSGYSYSSVDRWQRSAEHRRRFMVLWTIGLVEHGPKGAAAVEDASDLLKFFERSIQSPHRKAYEAAQQRWEATFGKHVEEGEAQDA
jgi:hypothetical protein